MKKLQGIIIILALMVGFFPTTAAYAGTTTVLPLMAGQTTQVGTVTVSDDGVNLTVTYDITVAGWTMTTTHLYVGTTAPKSGAPGQFPYQHANLPNVTTDTYTIPISIGTLYYIAAHAVVQSEGSGIIVGWDCPTLEEAAGMYSLPTSGTVKANNKYVNTYWDVYITTAGLLNGMYPGWCIDQTHSYFSNYIYQANFYSSYGQFPPDLIEGTDPYLDKEENLDLVNWVINNRDGYTIHDVQDVIWHLIDDNPYEPLTTNQQTLYNAALTHDGYVPDFSLGDVFTVVVSPIYLGAHHQTLLVEVPVQCTPIYQYSSETAWAQGTIPFKTGWGTYFTYTP